MVVVVQPEKLIIDTRSCCDSVGACTVSHVVVKDVFISDGLMLSTANGRIKVDRTIKTNAIG